jgi:ribosomal protein L7/L12
MEELLNRIEQLAIELHTLRQEFLHEIASHEETKVALRDAEYYHNKQIQSLADKAQSGSGALVSADELNRSAALLWNGYKLGDNRIGAIKALRFMYKIGLRDAKDAVEMVAGPSNRFKVSG